MDRRLVALLAALIVGLALPVAVDAAPAGRSVLLPPAAHVHGQSLARISGDWAAWAFGAPAETSPILNGACGQDPANPRIWFLTVAIVPGESTFTCDVPKGAVVLMTGAGYECSETEGNGSTEAELRACTESNFADALSSATVSVDGRAVSGLDAYIVTTPVVQLPDDNLFGATGGPSMTTGYFLLIKPGVGGTHTIRAVAAFSDGSVFTVNHQVSVH